LYGAHNSGIANGHEHAVDVTVGTVGGCRKIGRANLDVGEGGSA